MVFPECVVTPKSLIKAVATKVYVSGTLGIENAIFLAIEPESLGSTVMVGPFVLPHLCRNIKIFSPLLYALQLLHLRSFSFQKNTKIQQTAECKSQILLTSFFCLILKYWL